MISPKKLSPLGRSNSYWLDQLMMVILNWNDYLLSSTSYCYCYYWLWLQLMYYYYLYSINLIGLYYYSMMVYESLEPVHCCCQYYLLILSVRLMVQFVHRCGTRLYINYMTTLLPESLLNQHNENGNLSRKEIKKKKKINNQVILF